MSGLHLTANDRRDARAIIRRNLGLSIRPRDLMERYGELVAHCVIEDDTYNARFWARCYLMCARLDHLRELHGLRGDAITDSAIRRREQCSRFVARTVGEH